MASGQPEDQHQASNKHTAIETSSPNRLYIPQLNAGTNYGKWVRQCFVFLNQFISVVMIRPSIKGMMYAPKLTTPLRVQKRLLPILPNLSSTSSRQHIAIMTTPTSPPPSLPPPRSSSPSASLPALSSVVCPGYGR